MHTIYSLSFSDTVSVGVSIPVPSVTIACLVGFLLPVMSRKMDLKVRELVPRPSQSGYRPTQKAEQNIQRIPTTTHPVKNFLLKT